MASFWILDGEYAKSENQNIKFGDLVKPFGRKYSDMWRVFGISENGEIMLISDKCIGEVRLLGAEGYLSGIEQMDQLCIDTVKSSKVSAVRSISSLDFSRLIPNRKRYQMLKEYLYKFNYWLATTYVWTSDLYYEEGFEAVYDGAKVNMPLERFPGIEYNRKLGVRASVTLRNNVNFIKTEDGYWKI